MYLLCCARWQELDGISLVSGDTTRQEDGVFLCVVVHEGDQALDLVYSKSMLGPSFTVAMNPGCQPRSKIAGLHVLEAI